MAARGITQNHQVVRLDEKISRICAQVSDGQGQVQLGSRPAVRAVAVIQDEGAVTCFFQALCGQQTFAVEGDILISAAGADQGRGTHALQSAFRHHQADGMNIVAADAEMLLIPERNHIPVPVGIEEHVGVLHEIRGRERQTPGHEETVRPFLHGNCLFILRNKGKERIGQKQGHARAGLVQ